MIKFRLILFLAILGGSGLVAYLAASRDTSDGNETVMTPPSPSKRPGQRPSKRSEISAPLPLDKRKIEQMDPTNYEVTVSDIELEEIGLRIERESRERLRRLTDRYQLTANQRREAFPLLVSYHADYTDGLIVNGFEARPPRAENLSSELYLILDLTQQETYQEDVLADNEWWGEILSQLRSDLDRSLYSTDLENPAGRGGSNSPGAVDGTRIEPRKIDLDNLYGK